MSKVSGARVEAELAHERAHAGVSDPDACDRGAGCPLAQVEGEGEVEGEVCAHCGDEFPEHVLFADDGSGVVAGHLCHDCFVNPPEE